MFSERFLRPGKQCPVEIFGRAFLRLPDGSPFETFVL
jgi:hypothetical protein